MGSVTEAAMAKTRKSVRAVDPVWTRITDEAREAVRDEPLLGGLIHSNILHYETIEGALAYRIALKLASGEMSEQILREIADEAYASDPSLADAARSDIMAVYERDPACHRLIQPLLYFKGYQALQAYRLGHWLWTQGRGRIWPISSRCGCRRSSASTFTRPRGSVRGS
jgi:serine O-acetyltransferase